MIALFRDAIKALYKPVLVILLAAVVTLLWYVPRERQTTNPMWIEIVANSKSNHCEVTLWDGGRMVYSLVSKKRYDLVTKTCQIYVINH